MGIILKPATSVRAKVEQATILSAFGVPNTSQAA
jgi:hypothetical protein